MYGRFRGFESELTAYRPDAVMALYPLLMAQHIPAVLHWKVTNQKVTGIDAFDCVANAAPARRSERAGQASVLDEKDR